MRVKICGLRSAADLTVALGAGVDAVGFILGARHRTEDEITPELAATLVGSLPPFVSSVMVTHLQEADPILAIARRVKPTTLQLQDRIATGEIGRLRAGLPGIRLIQAVHVQGPDAIAAALAIEAQVDGLLLDSRTADRIGGTGLPHDWGISRRIVECAGRPVVLAGGLTPDNLPTALRTVGPAAVDVNSGVEDESGQKDPARLRAFVRICRAHSLSTLL